MKKIAVILLAVLGLLLTTACEVRFDDSAYIDTMPLIRQGEIPVYSGRPYIAINGNIPLFNEEEITESSFEYYSPLDNLGRCGSCVASIGQDLMPQKPRESISSVKPTGWQNKQYDHIDGKSLYNRCHLIGFQLTAENANQKNLITGTRYLNTEGMLPFENMVADYIKETGNHVMYRVTPHFVGDNLLASGVYMEGYSVEDEGAGICFFVYCYNVQPGIFLRYEDGANWEIEEGTYAPSEKEGDASYVLNVSSKKFHLPSCNGVRDMNEKNKVLSHESRELLIEEGFVPCGTCKP